MAIIEKPTWSLDGQTLSNVLVGNLYKTYNVVTTWWDGTPMDDTKRDDDLVYISYDGKYLRRNEPMGQVLQKDTVAQLKAISVGEILLLRIGVYKHVQLNGYYKKGDTPQPVDYVISSTSLEDDGGSVIQTTLGIKLEHDFKGLVDVKYYGVDLTTSVNNTVRINRCINRCKTALIDDSYWINTTNDLAGVIMTSGSSLTFTKKGEFKALPSASTNYRVILIYNVEGVVIENPKIIGERDNHTGTTGEWGHGISITNSRDVKIINANIKDCWGDGIYIGNEFWDSTSIISTENVLIDNPIIDNVRRNGISITSNKNVTVNNPKIYRTNGTSPEAGIDIEPEGADGLPVVCDNINIVNPETFNNNGPGIMLFLTTSITLTNNPKIDINIDNHIDKGSVTGFWIFQCPDGLVGSINVRNPSYFNNPRNGIAIYNFGKEKTLNLNIDNPKIVNWNRASSTFEPYRHGIYIGKESTDVYRNVDINIKNISFQYSGASGALPIVVASCNPKPNSVVLETISKLEGLPMVFEIQKGVSLLDTLKKSNGNYWETDILVQIVRNGRLLGTYTNEGIPDNANGIFTIEGNNWSEGQTLTFKVVNNSNLILSTDGTTTIQGNRVGGNISSNIIGDQIVLEYSQSKWYIVKQLGVWTNNKYSTELFFVGSEEPFLKIANAVWVDTVNNLIKVRDITNTAWTISGKKASASGDSASAPGATYSQTEAQGILSELRDLKTKLRAAGILDV